VTRLTEASPRAIDGDSVAVRPATDDDRDLLLRVYASTRADELDLVDWPAATKRSFVEIQFAAQDAHYRERYQGATFDLVVVRGRPCGRMYVDRRPTGIRLVDIALLPERRNAGVGSLLLRRLMDEAAGSGRTLSLHVEIGNPAHRLYTRLGFVPVAHDGIRLRMEWTPVGATSEAPAEPT
jgi:GNAT superfamily N-acetyltransferase